MVAGASSADAAVSEGTTALESVVAVTMTDTPSPWVLVTADPLSEGEGTGVEDSDIKTVPSGR